MYKANKHDIYSKKHANLIEIYLLGHIANEYILFFFKYDFYLFRILFNL